MTDKNKFVTPPAVFMYMEMVEKLEKELKQRDEIIEVLEESNDFYAHLDTYFAIGFFPDPPCGEFVNDFEEVYDEDFGKNVTKPGKRARATQKRVKELRGKYEK